MAPRITPPPMASTSPPSQRAAIVDMVGKWLNAERPIEDKLGENQ